MRSEQEAHPGVRIRNAGLSSSIDPSHVSCTFLAALLVDHHQQTEWFVMQEVVLDEASRKVAYRITGNEMKFNVAVSVAFVFDSINFLWTFSTSSRLRWSGLEVEEWQIQVCQSARNNNNNWPSTSSCVNKNNFINSLIKTKWRKMVLRARKTALPIILSTALKMDVIIYDCDLRTGCDTQQTQFAWSGRSWLKSGRNIFYLSTH